MMIKGMHGLGGRMGTRIIDPQPLIFDHAAQFFTVSDPQFAALVDECSAKGLVRKWEGTIGDLEVGGRFVPLPSSSPRYIGINRMRPLSDSILSEESVLTGCLLRQAYHLLQGKLSKISNRIAANNWRIKQNNFTADLEMKANKIKEEISISKARLGREKEILKLLELEKATVELNLSLCRDQPSATPAELQMPLIGSFCPEVSSPPMLEIDEDFNLDEFLSSF